MTIGSELNTLNPVPINYTDGLQLPPTGGKQGEDVVGKLHGDYYNAAVRKNLFSFLRTGITIPVVASGLVSVYSLWNPTNSGIMAEIVDTDVGIVNATSVVDVVGWYASSGSAALAGTFTTKAIAFGGTSPTYFSARTGEVPSGQVQPFTSYTHSGTPDRVDIICSFGAVTAPVVVPPGKEYKGRLLLMPGTVFSVAMSTGAGTGSGLDLSARWSEWIFATG